MTKPIWLFVAGHYRSGSTTQYQIARDIVEETGNGKGIGYHTEAKLKEFDAKSDHRYIVCKVFEFLPGGFRGKPSHGELIHRQGRLKALVTVRDPRDMIVSMRKRTQDQGNEFDFDKVVAEELPVWLANVEKWIDLGPEITYWSRFEDFTERLLPEVRQIARHVLDVPSLEVELAKDIAARYTIRAMEHKKQQFRRGPPDAKEDPWLPSVPGVLFGSSGQWRTWLNGPEKRLMLESVGGFIDRFGYERE